MKGFPNQVADLRKLAMGMGTLLRLVAQGDDAKDDGVFGEELVRAGVAGTGHTPMPVEEYLKQQRKKRSSNQSFRTTARGLREFYRLLGLIDDSGARVIVSELGRQAARFAGAPLDQDQRDFWRVVIRNVAHYGGQAEQSHPYQVLLRLVGRKPRISRAKCALALEARDDSPEELDRITELADLPESEILERLGVSQPNWDNAKKVLPSLAEQLKDVIVTRHDGEKTYRLADAPGRADVGAVSSPGSRVSVTRQPREPMRVGTAQAGRHVHGELYVREPGIAVQRAPRSSRQVTPETIGRAGTAEQFDEKLVTPPVADPAESPPRAVNVWIGCVATILWSRR